MWLSQCCLRGMPLPLWIPVLLLPLVAESVVAALLLEEKNRLTLIAAGGKGQGRKWYRKINAKCTLFRKALWDWTCGLVCWPSRCGTKQVQKAKWACL